MTEYRRKDDDSIVPQFKKQSYPEYDPIKNIIYEADVNTDATSSLCGLCPGVVRLSGDPNKIGNFLTEALKKISPNDYYALNVGETSGHLYPTVGLTRGAAVALLTNPLTTKYFRGRAYEDLEIIAGLREDPYNQVLKIWPNYSDENNEIGRQEQHELAQSIAKSIKDIDFQDDQIRSSIHEAQHYKNLAVAQEGVSTELEIIREHQFDRYIHGKSIEVINVLFDEAQQDSRLLDVFDETLAIIHDIFGQATIESLKGFGKNALFIRLAELLTLFHSGENKPSSIDIFLNEIFHKGEIPPQHRHYIAALIILLPIDFINLSLPNLIDWEKLVSDGKSEKKLSPEKKVAIARKKIFDLINETFQNPTSFGERLLESINIRLNLLWEGLRICKLRLAKKYLAIVDQHRDFFPDDIKVDKLRAFIDESERQL